MVGRSLIDPELLSLVDDLEGLADLPKTVDGLRIAISHMSESEGSELPATLSSASHKMSGPVGTIDVPVVCPKQASTDRPAILYIHGGGYIAGKPEDGASFAMMLASELDCVVVCARYRLAPETQAPGALEDCYATLAWMHENARMLGIDSSRIAVWGDSAGGGLAAGLGILARDRNEYQIAYQVLVYPMLDDRTVSRNDVPPHIGEILWTREWNKIGWSAYLGETAGSKDVSPYAAPARVESMEGLPPTLIATAALDLFVTENLDFAQRLILTGVPTEVHVAPGAFHGFEIASEARVTQTAIKVRLDALRRALFAPSKGAPT